jgi:plasmid stabilization system protein ParE
MDLLLRPAAAADVEEAFSWYERQRPGLGEQFLESVNAGLRDMAAYPLCQAIIFRDTRPPAQALSLRYFLPCVSRRHRRCRVHARLA